MKKVVNASLLMLLWVGVLFSCTAQVPKADLKTDVDSVSYAQGVLMSSAAEQAFMQLQLDSSNKTAYMKAFKEGFLMNEKDKNARAAALGKIMGISYGTEFVKSFNQQLFGTDSTQTLSRENFLSGFLGGVNSDTTTLMNRQEAQMYAMTAMEGIRKAAVARQYADVKKANEDWLEKNKSNEGVQVTPSGLQYKVEREGTGVKPVASDRVKVYYRGTNIKGEEFETKIDGEPVEFPLGNVIKGWTEGIQLMPVGSKYILYVPASLAYGEQQRSEQIQPFSTLIFEVELLDIVK
jgi:FKBP-type peptidyl-prolyl cis-trans isomerase FklB